MCSELLLVHLERASFGTFIYVAGGQALRLHLQGSEPTFVPSACVFVQQHSRVSTTQRHQETIDVQDSLLLSLCKHGLWITCLREKDGLSSHKSKGNCPTPCVTMHDSESRVLRGPFGPSASTCRLRAQDGTPQL